MNLVYARSVIRYKSKADPQIALRMRLRELAAVRVGYGYRRLHILLWREGWNINHKRVEFAEQKHPFEQAMIRPPGTVKNDLHFLKLT